MNFARLMISAALATILGAGDAVPGEREPTEVLSSRFSGYADRVGGIWHPQRKIGLLVRWEDEHLALHLSGEFWGRSSLDLRFVADDLGFLTQEGGDERPETGFLRLGSRMALVQTVIRNGDEPPRLLRLALHRSGPDLILDAYGSEGGTLATLFTAHLQPEA